MLKPDYGEKITSGNIEVYHNENNVDAEEARRLADYLASSMNPETTISFRISKNERGFYLGMVSTPEKANTLADSEYYNMATVVSKNVFTGAPVNFQLTNDKFEPFKTFEFKSEMTTPEKSTGNQ